MCGLLSEEFYGVQSCKAMEARADAGCLPSALPTSYIKKGPHLTPELADLAILTGSLLQGIPSLAPSIGITGSALNLPVHLWDPNFSPPAYTSALSSEPSLLPPRASLACYTSYLFLFFPTNSRTPGPGDPIYYIISNYHSPHCKPMEG